MNNPFRYAGESYDDETGFYYLRARFYDPSVGRFITEDTFTGQIDNPLSLNRYTYTYNNPLKFVDPSGNDGIAVAVGGWVATGVEAIAVIPAAVAGVFWAANPTPAGGDLTPAEKAELERKLKEQKKVTELTRSQERVLKDLDNIINDHLTEQDFSGAERDMRGDPVPNGKGGFFDHLKEVKDAATGLEKVRKSLEGSLKNPNLDNTIRKKLQDALDKTNRYLDRVDKLLNGTNKKIKTSR